MGKTGAYGVVSLFIVLIVLFASYNASLKNKDKDKNKKLQFNSVAFNTAILQLAAAASVWMVSTYYGSAPSDKKPTLLIGVLGLAMVSQISTTALFSFDAQTVGIYITNAVLSGLLICGVGGAYLMDKNKL